MGIPKKVKNRNEKEGKAKNKRKKRKEKTSRCMGLGAFPLGAHSPEWFPARTGLEGHGIQSGLESGFLASAAVSDISGSPPAYMISDSCFPYTCR